LKELSNILYMEAEKAKSLNYKYNANDRTLTTDSMIRKKRKIKLV